MLLPERPDVESMAADLDQTSQGLDETTSKLQTLSIEGQHSPPDGASESNVSDLPDEDHEVLPDVSIPLKLLVLSLIFEALLRIRL